MSNISNLIEIEGRVMGCINQVITCVIVNLPINVVRHNTTNLSDMFTLRSIICSDYFKCENGDQKRQLMEMFIEYNKQISKVLGIVVEDK